MLLAPELAARLLARERAAVPEALNLVDDARPEARERALELLCTLERELPERGALRVGLTGAPGAGKSTLLDALVPELRGAEQTLGIVAVDPSSRVSGGALLGDRFRVRSGASDPGVFLRSMAARERLGGVADATRASVTVLAAVFDWVIVETVGVGQSESDVSALVDTLVYVAQPGAGDTLQFMKAGILEHPDVFVVNKADLGAVAERTASELRAGLGLASREADPWTPPVILLSARERRGVGDLVAAVRGHRAHLEESERLAERRRRGLERSLVEALEQRYGSYGLERVGGRTAVRRRLREAPDAGFFEAVRAWGREIEGALRAS